MRDHRVPLIFLEACQTAMAELDPAASVAGKLLDQGVASVVAMSHAVLVETAKRFVAAFYGSLMKGERIGDAMLAGQRALALDPWRGRGFDGDFELQDWFVPVLYQKETDLQLIQALPAAQARELTEKRRESSFGSLPEPQHGFIGRSRELLALERLLENERHAVVLGEGGEGKTTLAAELARWLVRTRRFARAAFVGVENALDLRSVIWDLGAQLVPNFASKAGAEPKKAVKLIERALRERATIVVFDNMESILPPREGAEDFATYEPKLLAGLLELCKSWSRDGDTRIVFTSREALPAPFALAKNTVKIGRLSRNDAIRLVARVLGEEEERPAGGDVGESEDEVVQLVDAVNRHARSLVLVAKEVAISGVSGATERLEALMARMAEREGDEREQSLFASVELSLRRLPEETRRKLPRLGVFRGGGQLGVIAHVLGLGNSADDAVPLAQQLVGVGLGEMLPYGHLRLHPALGPLLSRELDEAEREEARRAWVGAMVALARYLRQQRDQETQLTYRLTLLELPNLLGALELLPLSVNAEQVVGIATDIEGLLQALGRPRAMARVVHVREAAAKGLAGWTPGRFLAEASRVERTFQAGHFREANELAHALLQKVEMAGIEAYDEAEYDLAMANTLVGQTLQLGGDAQAALQPNSEARARFQKLGDAGNREAARMAAVSLTRIGDCLRDLGRLDEAAAAYEESIRLAEELGDRRTSAVAKGQLGTVRMLQQRYGDALSAWNDARQTFEQLGELGSVAGTWHQIGVVHQEAGQSEAAERAYQQALRIKVRRRDRSGEANSLDQLGLLYRAMGRVEDSVRFHRQATDIRTELGDLIAEGRSRSNVAIVLIQLQRYDEARQEILRAIECDKPYGHAAEPWKTFDILHDLERVVGNATAAEDARAQAVAAFLAYRRAGGENHEGGAQLVAVIGQAVASGESADAAKQLAEIRTLPDLADQYKALVPVLQQILDGARDPALAETAGLYYMDAVEVRLLLEGLG